jgi:hypothetical protein
MTRPAGSEYAGDTLHAWAVVKMASLREFKKRKTRIAVPGLVVFSIFHPSFLVAFGAFRRLLSYDVFFWRAHGAT